MHLPVPGHDTVERACAVRLHGQPRRPVRRRPQSPVCPGGVRKPRLHELPVGVPELFVRQVPSPRLDFRVAQDAGYLGNGADVGVHDSVHERRSLRFG